MREGKADEVVESVLNDLIEYTRYHFSWEEELFTSNGYPQAEMHKTEHKKMIKEVLLLHRNLVTGDKLIVTEVMNFLVDWLSLHIMGTDKKYSSYLNSKGIY